jgi:hypothetical protein
LTSIAPASVSPSPSPSGSVVVTTTLGTVVRTTNVAASTQAAVQTGGVAPAKTAAVGMGLLGFAVGVM